MQLPFRTQISKRAFNPYSKQNLTPAITNQRKQTNFNNHFQTRLDNTWNTDEVWAGDAICEPEPYIARFWLQNTNGIDISCNFSQYMESLDNLRRYNIQFLAIPETKLNPLNFYIRDNLEAAHTYVYPEGHVKITNTTIDPTEIRQYGGVLACTQGSLANRFASSGRDDFGRFTWIDFYGKNTFLKVYSVYRVNKGGDSTSGDNTAWTNQRTVLLENNITTNPREHIITTLCNHIKKDFQQSRSVIICGDMNENIFANGISSSLEKMGLVNLFKSMQHNLEGVRSCSSGSTIIDGVWMSQNVYQRVTRKGFAPFDFIFSSDHRGLYFDIDIRDLLDNTCHNLILPTYRRLKSRIPTRVQKYSDIVFTLWEEYHITDRISHIKHTSNNCKLSPELIQDLNKIDDDIQMILSRGEKGCCNTSRHCVDSWSPQLKQSLRSLRQLKGLIRKSRKSNTDPNLLRKYIKQSRLAKIR